MTRGHHIDSEGRFRSDKYPDLEPDKIVVSFRHPQARRALYALADGYADIDAELAADIRERLRSLEDAERAEKQEREQARRRELEATTPPVDRSQRQLTDGSPVTEDHREIDPATGQQKAYVVLSPEERAKGFVRPVRRTYTHNACRTTTTMGQALAETYARDPKFYGGTFCVACRNHFPVDQFVWEGTNETVGS